MLYCKIKKLACAFRSIEFTKNLVHKRSQTTLKQWKMSKLGRFFCLDLPHIAYWYNPNTYIDNIEFFKLKHMHQFGYFLLEFPSFLIKKFTFNFALIFIRFRPKWFLKLKHLICTHLKRCIFNIIYVISQSW